MFRYVPFTSFHRGLGCRCGVLATALLVIAMASTATVPQMNMSGHDMGMPMREIPPPAKLPAPLELTGIGNSHLAITATPKAQMWFDQGLNLLNDFWDYESERAFEQSIRADSQCAMCYWGLYQALMFRHSMGTAYSEQALASAVILKDHAGKAEQLYIEASVAGSDAAKTAGEEVRSDNQKEIIIWRQLVKEYPSDLQAKIFLSSTLRDGYDDAGEPKKGTKESMAILQDILKVAPNDSAANHYWIHAVEASAHPEQALNSATVLANLAPASGHMVHMPGHIFYRVGDYAQAEHWFAQSTGVDEKYMRDQRVDVDDDWNYVHNLMYGIANLMEEGKLEQATKLSGKLSGARGELTETLYLGSPRDGYARLDAKLPVALRTGDWAAVLKMLETVKPADKLENLKFLAGQLKEFVAGMQAVQTSNLAAAQTASLKLDAELWHMSQRVKDAPKKKKETPTLPVMSAVMPDAQAGPLLSSLSIMSLELRAAILAEQKRLPEAKALFAQAAQEEKALGYREPPTYIRPVGEAEGAALMRAGDYSDAHKAYAAALVERPRSGFPLFGMARSSEAAGDEAMAAKEYAEFANAWKEGNQDLPQMAHAREFLSVQKKRDRALRSRRQHLFLRKMRADD
jgi:tetratricopeptide (TPR) repeat protein